MENSRRAGAEPPLESNSLRGITRCTVSVARGVANRQKGIREAEQQSTTSSHVETNSQTR
jgi:hypothetical protein